MDGTLAVLFLVAGVTDMSLNYCGTEGCLAKAVAQSRLSVSGGDVQFQDDSIGEEIYLRYEYGHTYGPFQPAAGVSVTSHRDTWIGLGATYGKHFANDRAYLQLSLMPGLYAQADGPDLGHAIEFRSGIELGYETGRGVRFGISYDHRSNADLDSVNPGLETVQFRVSTPFD